jgi:hypothetical protein
MAQQPGGLHREVFAGLLVEVVQIDARAAPKRFQKASSRRSRGAGTAAGSGATAGTRVGTIRLSWSICA